jgi:hypothetical protein
MIQYKLMGYDYIPTIRGYSLSDFHDFDTCIFKFLVKHHLGKKYEIGKGSPQMALGVLLDKTIKVIHSYGEKSYRATPERLVGAVRFSAKKIIVEEKQSPKHPNFNTATVEFLTEEVLIAAENALLNYLTQIKTLKKSLGEITFLQKTVEIDGEKYKLWGGPDTLEIGDDGMPEIIDYKSRQDIAKGKQHMDMDLMPKMYTLLMTEELLNKGYKKARFKVKFWQDPLDESFAQDFDLESLVEVEDLFKEKIRKINQNKLIDFCLMQYCEACNSDKSDDYVAELEKMGYSLV